ncbi:MAG: PEP-CTERM sorting domain-containing protein [Planctomycetia bacterium]
MAIDIVMTFNSGASTSPSFDSNGSKLTALMAAAESYYEDIFTADWTLNVEFYYADFDGGTLGRHNNLGTSGGKPTSCRIRIDDDHYWFIDDTPFNNSEYDMDLTYAGDLGSPGTYYNGTVPDMLEYSHRGYSSGDEGFLHYFQQDMWSVVLHEMGHALGMTSNVASGETGDYDYDYDSDLVWGNTMAAKCEASDNRYHLKAQTMMNPTNNMGYRTLPSMTDIFAIETAANWGDTTIRLERVDFYSTDTNADLNQGNNWSGNLWPDYDQEAWIRDGGTASITSHNIGANNLYIGNDTIVQTGAYRLRSDHNIYLGDSDGYGIVVINTGGELQCDITLDVKSGSMIQMQAGSLLDADQLRLNSGSGISGAGTIDIEDWFNNNGNITVTGGDLIIDSDVNVNLDGTNETGTVYVTGGSLTYNRPLKDAFSTYMEVGNDCTATFDQGWTLSSAGTLYLNGNTDKTYRAAIDGGLFQVAGTVNINHQTRFLCDSLVKSTAEVNINDSNDMLYIHGDSTIEAGADFSGSGRLFSNADLVLEDGAVVGVRLSNNNDLTIEENGIGSATVNASFDNRDGHGMLFEVNGDESCDLLDVNSTATLNGDLYIDFIGGYTPSDGDSFTIMTYNSRSGTFDSITYSGAFDLIASYGSTALTLTVDYGDSATTVPEPSTLVLLVGIGCCLGLFWRKRR